MPKYCLEFILNIPSGSVEALKNSIVELGEDLDISQVPEGDEAKDNDFKICIYTEDPTIIFDTCAQFGRLKAVKVQEKTPS